MRSGRWATGLGLAGVTAYAVVLAVGMVRSTYDVWGAMVVGPGLLVVSWPLLVVASRREEDPWIRRLIVVAFCCKLSGALVRWGVALVLYDGVSDAARYDEQGAAIARNLWDGNIAAAIDRPLTGTGFLELLTGIVYTLTGPTLLGGYLVFAWFGFWGLYFFYRAFRTALPGVSYRRYALLVFLLPSMLFWPSGIGKEAWMCLCIGLATFGAARLLTGTPGAVLPLALGFLGSAVVRPHMTGVIFLATVAAFMFRRDARRTPLTPLARTGTLVALGVVGVWIAGQAADFFQVDDASVESFTSVRDNTEERQVGGGSAFQAQAVHSPADYPAATLTVLYRPFPWEAGTVQGLATSVEGMLLLGLTLASWPRLRNIWRFRPGRAYAVLCVAYILTFVYAFSTFNNFGLLARQRVLVYPFLLVLLCLPTAKEMRLRGLAVAPPSAERKVLQR
jgi:hypothetical protein